MTNLDARPREHLGARRECTGPEVTVLQPRTVPLGGIRALPVERTLPHRDLSLIGAWCFLDRFTAAPGAAMTVLPHPHTALQTVTWPLTGEIRHRDSLGNDLIVKPGELNLMTAGAGVSHSEFSTGPDPLAGVQLWLALPTGPDTGPADFEQVTQLPTRSGPGWEFTVFIGDLDGATSPATVFSPLVGADGVLAPGAQVTLPLNPAWEHGLLVFDGQVQLHDDVDDYLTDRARPSGSTGREDSVRAGLLSPGHLAYVGIHREQLTFTAGAQGARVVLIGGAPFAEPVVMFWNFIGRTHEDVAAAAAAWEQDWRGGANERYGLVPGHRTDHIPGPALPPVRLRPRRSPHLRAT